MESGAQTGASHSVWTAVVDTVFLHGCSRHERRQPERSHLLPGTICYFVQDRHEQAQDVHSCSTMEPKPCTVFLMDNPHVFKRTDLYENSFVGRPLYGTRPGKMSCPHAGCLAALSCSVGCGVHGDTPQIIHRTHIQSPSEGRLQKLVLPWVSGVCACL